MFRKSSFYLKFENDEVDGYVLDNNWLSSAWIFNDSFGGCLRAVKSLQRCLQKNKMHGWAQVGSFEGKISMPS